MKKQERSFYRKILIINAADRSQTELGLIDDGRLVLCQKYDRMAQDLPELIESFLKLTKSALEKLDLIGVAVSGSSLTGIRVSVATANTIAQHLGISIAPLETTTVKEAALKLQNGEFSANKQIDKID